MLHFEHDNFLSIRDFSHKILFKNVVHDYIGGIYMNNMGIKIAAKRKDIGMTQIEFAEKLSVTRQTVSRWESGSVMPDIDKIPVYRSRVKVFALSYSIDPTMDDAFAVGLSDLFIITVTHRSSFSEKRQSVRKPSFHPPWQASSGRVSPPRNMQRPQLSFTGVIMRFAVSFLIKPPSR